MTTPKRALPWFEDLTDSVTALREAAYDYKNAHRAALVLRDSVAIDRRRLEDGKATGQPGPEAQGWNARPITREPHANALFDLIDMFGTQAAQIAERFEHAALLYASGAAWAIRQVQQGATPSHVVFALSPERQLFLPGALEIEGIDRYSEASKVAAAYQELTGRLRSAEYGEDLASQDNLADHEAGWMTDAWNDARGTGRAAYAYGLLAERALSYALLGVRNGTSAT